MFALAKLLFKIGKRNQQYFIIQVVFIIGFILTSSFFLIISRSFVGSCVPSYLCLLLYFVCMLYSCLCLSLLLYFFAPVPFPVLCHCVLSCVGFFGPAFPRFFSIKFSLLPFLLLLFSFNFFLSTLTVV